MFVVNRCGSAIAPVYAQTAGQIAVSNSTIQVDYPNSLTFSCHVQNNTNITDIRLEYQVTQMSYAQVTSEAEVTLTHQSRSMLLTNLTCSSTAKSLPELILNTGGK